MSIKKYDLLPFHQGISHNLSYLVTKRRKLVLLFKEQEQNGDTEGCKQTEAKINSLSSLIREKVAEMKAQNPEAWEAAKSEAIRKNNENKKIRLVFKLIQENKIEECQQLFQTIDSKYHLILALELINKNYSNILLENLQLIHGINDESNHRIIAEHLIDKEGADFFFYYSSKLNKLSKKIIISILNEKKVLWDVDKSLNAPRILRYHHYLALTIKPLLLRKRRLQNELNTYHKSSKEYQDLKTEIDKITTEIQILIRKKRLEDQVEWITSKKKAQLISKVFTRDKNSEYTLDLSKTKSIKPEELFLLAIVLIEEGYTNELFDNYEYFEGLNNTQKILEISKIICQNGQSKTLIDNISKIKNNLDHYELLKVAEYIIANGGVEHFVSNISAFSELNFIKLAELFSAYNLPEEYYYIFEPYMDKIRECENTFDSFVFEDTVKMVSYFKFLKLEPEDHLIFLLYTIRHRHESAPIIIENIQLLHGIKKENFKQIALEIIYSEAIVQYNYIFLFKFINSFITDKKDKNELILKFIQNKNIIHVKDSIEILNSTSANFLKDVLICIIDKLTSDDFISNSSDIKLIFNNIIKRLDKSEYQKEIALHMIEKGHGLYICKNIQKFKLLNNSKIQKDIILRLINSNIGDGFIKNFTDFNKIEKNSHKEIVDLLIKKKCEVANYFEIFTGIKLKDHKEIVMNLIPYSSESVSKNFHKFSGIKHEDHMEIVKLMLGQKYNTAFAENIEKFQGISPKNHLELVHNLIDTNKGSEVFNFFENFNGIDPKHHLEIVESLILKGGGKAVCKNFEKFYGIDPMLHKRIGILCIENDEGCFLAEYLYKFSGIKPVDHLEIIRLLTKHENYYNYLAIFEFFDNFSGIGKEFHKEIIIETIRASKSSEEFLENINKFDLTQEDCLQIIDEIIKVNSVIYLIINISKFKFLDVEQTKQIGLKLIRGGHQLLLLQDSNHRMFFKMYQDYFNIVNEVIKSGGGILYLRALYDITFERFLTPSKLEEIRRNLFDNGMYIEYFTTSFSKDFIDDDYEYLSLSISNGTDLSILEYRLTNNLTKYNFKNFAAHCLNKFINLLDTSDISCNNAIFFLFLLKNTTNPTISKQSYIEKCIISILKAIESDNLTQLNSKYALDLVSYFANSKELSNSSVIRDFTLIKRIFPSSNYSIIQNLLSIKTSITHEEKELLGVVGSSEESLIRDLLDNMVNIRAKLLSDNLDLKILLKSKLLFLIYKELMKFNGSDEELRLFIIKYIENRESGKIEPLSSAYFPKRAKISFMTEQSDFSSEKYTREFIDIYKNFRLNLLKVFEILNNEDPYEYIVSKFNEIILTKIENLKPKILDPKISEFGKSKIRDQLNQLETIKINENNVDSIINSFLLADRFFRNDFTNLFAVFKLLLPLVEINKTYKGSVFKHYMDRLYKIIKSDSLPNLLELNHLEEFITNRLNIDYWKRILDVRLKDPSVGNISRQIRRFFDLDSDLRFIRSQIKLSTKQYFRASPEKTRDVTFIPSRTTLFELSGFHADACWDSLYGSLGEKYKNVFSVTIMQETPDKRIIGSFILIESTNKEGEPILIIRGLNPEENIANLVDMNDFYEKVITYARELADNSGRRLAITYDGYRGGATTNRQAVVDFLKTKWDSYSHTILDVRTKSERTFNKYGIESYVYYV